MLPELCTAIPGPRSHALAESLRRYESRNVTYLDTDFPVFWERAEGVNVWDVDGNRFLDITSAFAVASLGHNAPAIREAARIQADKLLHAMGDVHPTEAKSQLCRRLSEITFERWKVGTAKTILCNSGSEAVEAALKTALLHNAKPGVIAFTGGYHGLGYGALDTVGIPYFSNPFKAQLARFTEKIPYPSCYHCPFHQKEDYRLEGDPFPNCSSHCLEEIRKRIYDTLRKHEIGCILVEPIQGRGGEIVPPRDFLTLLRQICDEEKILLIVDEIYTGFNRTGRLFACEHFPVIPDIICVGKALTGGFPLAACVARSDIMDAWPVSGGEALHTSTFLGNPVGCAMALASIEEHLKPETTAQVRAAGKMFIQSLRKIQSPLIANVRGVGLMIGMELSLPNGEPATEAAISIVKSALKDGLLLLAGGPASNVLSFTPPFAISEEEVRFVSDRIQEYLTSLPGSIS
ncbi:MAG: aspartate aminotransferase family protein [Chthoniobacterales bacterium]